MPVFYSVTIFFFVLFPIKVHAMCDRCGMPRRRCLVLEHLISSSFEVHTFTWLGLFTKFVFVPWTLLFLVIEFRSLFCSFWIILSDFCHSSKNHCLQIGTLIVSIRYVLNTFYIPQIQSISSPANIIASFVSYFICQ